jgi:hypothetical protein
LRFFAELERFKPAWRRALPVRKKKKKREKGFKPALRRALPVISKINSKVSAKRYL